MASVRNPGKISITPASVVSPARASIAPDAPDLILASAPKPCPRITATPNTADPRTTASVASSPIAPPTTTNSPISINDQMISPNKIRTSAPFVAQGGLAPPQCLHKDKPTELPTLGPYRQRHAMNSSVIQLLVLAGIAVFLILKLRSVLGTREGFERPPVAVDEGRPTLRRASDATAAVNDPDISDNTSDPAAAAALSAMKAAEPAFNVTDFLKGARGAYEMILMAFDKGDLARVKPFLGDHVASTFASAVAERDSKGLTIESTFSGIREMALSEATFDPVTKTAEIAVRFTGELFRALRDKSGTVVEGGPTTILRQRDTWTFGRKMGAGDPNWQLVATGD